MDRRVFFELLIARILQDCSISAARQEEIRKAWEERDAERARECQLAGHCGGGGGP